MKSFYYNYNTNEKTKYGTPYDKQLNNVKPITFDISGWPGAWTLTPDEYLQNATTKVNMSFTRTYNDSSLLRAIANVMANLTEFCYKYYLACMHDKTGFTPDKRFFDNDNTFSVNVFINYTNDMIFNDTTLPKEIVTAACGKVSVKRLQYDDPSSKNIEFKLDKKIAEPLNLFNKMTPDKYYNNYRKTTDLVDVYLKNAVDNDFIKKLKINDGYDTPKKLCVFGIADPISAYNSQSLVAVLFVEHETTAEEILKYRETANKYLKRSLDYHHTKTSIDEVLQIDKSNIDKYSIDELCNICGSFNDMFDPLYCYTGGEIMSRSYDGIMPSAKKFYPELAAIWQLVKDTYRSKFKDFNSDRNTALADIYKNSIEDEVAKQYWKESKEISSLGYFTRSFYYKNAKTFFEEEDYKCNFNNMYDYIQKSNEMYLNYLDYIKEPILNQLKQDIYKLKEEEPTARKYAGPLRINLKEADTSFYANILNPDNMPNKLYNAIKRVTGLSYYKIRDIANAFAYKHQLRVSLIDNVGKVTTLNRKGSFNDIDVRIDKLTDEHIDSLDLSFSVDNRLTKIKEDAIVKSIKETISSTFSKDVVDEVAQKLYKLFKSVIKYFDGDISFSTYWDRTHYEDLDSLDANHLIDDLISRSKKSLSDSMYSIQGGLKYGISDESLNACIEKINGKAFAGINELVIDTKLKFY